MNIEFKKLRFENRFDTSFENWDTNNVIEFPPQGFINIYGPNGVGKSSFAKTLKNSEKGEYEFIYNGQTYTEKNSDNKIMVIDDFFFRNIASRDKEKLSDYVLGTQIAKELEVKEKIEDSCSKVKSDIGGYLKEEYAVKTKDSCLSKIVKNNELKLFINALCNTSDRGKKYNVNELIELSNGLKLNEECDYNTAEYEFIKDNVGSKDSIITNIIDFDIDNLRIVPGIKKIELDNDAIQILEKHKGLKKCIFEESHVLPENIKENLEKNKALMMKSLTESQKKVVEMIYKLPNDPLNLKNIFNLVFENGNVEGIKNIILKIKNIVYQIENEIILKIKEIVKVNNLQELNREYTELINKKIELSEDDELLLKSIIENCINKEVKFDRDNNKNIIFTIANDNIIGKSRQDLPLSTGEQNFISLYFELLSAKNSTKEIIVIDDPISSFDSIFKNKIIYSIIKVLSGKKKVIILTHNINTIKLMHHQFNNCFNLYLLKNELNGNNGFIKIDKKDMYFLLEIRNVIELFRDNNLLGDIKSKKHFLISLIPFMRSFSNLFPASCSTYKNLCKLMHGYENEKVDINEEYNNIFHIDVMGTKYEINTDDILSISSIDEIVCKSKYPLLNRTLCHNFNYLKMRLLVEKTLYKTDTNRLDWSKYPTLHQMIEKYLSGSLEYKNKLLAKKTLLNEFNHFEYDMCLFLPSLDISDTKLNEEIKDIEAICKDIDTNGI